MGIIITLKYLLIIILNFQENEEKVDIEVLVDDFVIFFMAGKSKYISMLCHNIMFCYQVKKQLPMH